MKNKIGIITHYTNNMNYGGALQAYALCKVLNHYGFEAEQIQYLGESFYLCEQKSSFCTQNKVVKSLKRIKGKIYAFLYAMIDTKRRKVYFKYRTRVKKMKAFLNAIPHSSKCYTKNTIKEVEKEYNVFITGSDQVWNPKWYKDVYFLDFVSSTPKFSYAASISQNQLNDYQKSVYANSLKSFQAISVREAEGQALLQDIVDKPIEWVLDPTLLLSREDWNNLSASRLIEKKYLFCYFFGEDITARSLAREYAEKHNLLLVFLPHIFGVYRQCDSNFADIELYSISPSEFISLIQYAEFVFTDSFHACVFSEIFNRQYFVFKRDSSNEMGSRLYSLTKIFRHEDRCLDDNQKININYIENTLEIDYSNQSNEFLKMKEKSIDYLIGNLDKHWRL